MKKGIPLGLVAMLGVTMLSGPHVFASSSSHSIKRDSIRFNGKQLYSPYGLIANNTTYMPIWYVQQALKQIGVKETWDGHTWNIETSQNADMSNVRAGAGSVAIQVNGMTVERANGITATDPASNKTTMYMPIWYVQQALKRIGVTSTWNGSAWTLTTQQSASQPSGNGGQTASTSNNSQGHWVEIGGKPIPADGKANQDIAFKPNGNIVYWETGVPFAASNSNPQPKALGHLYEFNGDTWNERAIDPIPFYPEPFVNLTTPFFLDANGNLDGVGMTGTMSSPNFHLWQNSNQKWTQVGKVFVGPFMEFQGSAVGDRNGTIYIAGNGQRIPGGFKQGLDIIHSDGSSQIVPLPSNMLYYSPSGGGGFMGPAFVTVSPLGVPTIILQQRNQLTWSIWTYDNGQWSKIPAFDTLGQSENIAPDLMAYSPDGTLSVLVAKENAAGSTIPVLYNDSPNGVLSKSNIPIPNTPARWGASIARMIYSPNGRLTIVRQTGADVTNQVLINSVQYGVFQWVPNDTSKAHTETAQVNDFSGVTGSIEFTNNSGRKIEVPFDASGKTAALPFDPEDGTGWTATSMKVNYPSAVPNKVTPVTLTDLNTTNQNGSLMVTPTTKLYAAQIDFGSEYPYPGVLSFQRTSDSTNVADSINIPFGSNGKTTLPIPFDPSSSNSGWNVYLLELDKSQTYGYEFNPGQWNTNMQGNTMVVTPKPGMIQ